MVEYPSFVEVIEVGPRDGFQNIKTHIPTKIKLAVIDQMIASGIRKIEITSFVHPKAIPQMADASEVVQAVFNKYQDKDIAVMALIPNLTGAKNASKYGIKEVAYVISASEKHNLANINRTREQSLSELTNIIDQLPDLNIRLDVATAFGCPFAGKVDNNLVLSLIDEGIKLGVSTIVLCDTIGIANPRQVYELVKTVKMAYPAMPIGLHLHDTRGMGLANTLAGLQAGVTMFETSIGGLGGCPFAPGAAGNTATEDMVNMLKDMDIETGINLEKYLEAVRFVRKEVQLDLSGHMASACMYENI